MNLLFDVSASEGDGQEKKSRRRAVARVEQEKPAQSPSYIGNWPVKAILPIGKADDMFNCACGASCHDILHEEGREWYVSCCFCGTCEWVQAVEGHLQPKKEEFVFRDGRFAGLTVAEAARQPRGLDYITQTAKTHRRQAVRDACQAHLDQVSQGR